VDFLSAVLFGNAEITEKALSAAQRQSPAFSINAVDAQGFTALHYAARRPHVPILKLLAERGADLNAKSQNQFAEPPLASAVIGGGSISVDNWTKKRRRRIQKSL
jgi:ankyrin repeat protein